MLEGGNTIGREPLKEGQAWNLSEVAQQCLLTLLRKFKNMYKFVLANGCKPSLMQPQHPEDEEQEDSKSAGFVEAYIKKTYPTNRLSRWDTTLDGLMDSSRYGSRAKSLPSSKSLGQGSGQNSLSCRAVLGLILTKSIYLLQDTSMIGTLVKLIQETLNTATEVFNIEGNCEFAEWLHLSLFSFDKVSASTNILGLRILQRATL